MEKKRIITISGLPGTGTSTAAVGAQEFLGLVYHSTGDHFREIAQRRGVSLGELVEIAKTDNTIDDEIDNTIKEIGRKSSRYVIDSRIAFHWIPDSFKVRLYCTPEVAANRIYQQLVFKGRVSQSADSFDQVLRDSELRRISDRYRYIDKYHVDLEDTSMFDLEIDTGIVSMPDMVAEVVQGYRKWLKS